MQNDISEYLINLDVSDPITFLHIFVQWRVSKTCGNETGCNDFFSDPNNKDLCHKYDMFFLDTLRNEEWTMDNTYSSEYVVNCLIAEAKSNKVKLSLKNAKLIEEDLNPCAFVQDSKSDRNRDL